MKRLSRLAIGCSLFAVGAICWAQPRPVEPSQRLKAGLGVKVIGILKEPTKVEVFRLDPQYVGKVDDKHFIGYPIKSAGKEQGTDFGSKLTTLLFQDKAWFNPNRFVQAWPLVGYRIWKDTEAVDVVYDGRGRVEARPHGNKGRSATGDCYPINAAFMKLAIEAFPDDEELKKWGDIKNK